MTDAARLTSDPETDRRLMAAALRHGRRNQGRTHPAPAVGALVVRFDGGRPVVVGRGVTSPGGLTPASVAALTEAGDLARGATFYTTLEPLMRHGDGYSETDALIAAGITRLVSAMDDPDPRRTRSGYARLREAGIDVTAGVLGEEARRAHAGYISVVRDARPHVTLKLAVSADGMIGRKSGERTLVSGPGAFRRLQMLRIESDASLIGIETALVNDPSLVVRVAGLRHLSPIRVVLDADARLDPSSALVAGAHEVPLWLFVGLDAPPSAVAQLEEAGATVLTVGTGTGGLDMRAVMRHLAERGITRLLVEGGARVAATVVGQGLADEVVLFRAPVVIGPDGVRALAGGALSAIERSPRYRIVEDASLGEDRLIRFERTT